MPYTCFSCHNRHLLKCKTHKFLAFEFLHFCSFMFFIESVKKKRELETIRIFYEAIRMLEKSTILSYNFNGCRSGGIGRRGGLKIRRGLQLRVGSTPTLGTTITYRARRGLWSLDLKIKSPL